MGYLGRRNSPDLKAKHVFTKDEINAVTLYSKTKKQTLPHTSSAKHCTHALARLKGFLQRKSDGTPGPLVMWRGYLRLQDIVLGISPIPP